MDDTNQNETDELEHRLSSGRPVPRAGFRAQLRTHLLATIRSRRTASHRVRLLIAAYGVSGAALLLVATFGVAGAGPLAS